MISELVANTGGGALSSGPLSRSVAKVAIGSSNVGRENVAVKKVRHKARKSNLSRYA